MFLEWDGFLPSYDERKSKMTSTVEYNLPYLYMPKITNVVSEPSKLADLTKFYMDDHWYAMCKVCASQYWKRKMATCLWSLFKRHIGSYGGNIWQHYLSETTEITWAKYVINIPCMNLCNVCVLDRAESLWPPRWDIV